MQKKYEEIMQEVDRRVSAIHLNGKHIIKDCKAIIVFLKEKMSELKEFVRCAPFNDETEEITFFKRYKPTLVGWLIYFHKILRIESQRPLGEEELEGYYEKKQEELKKFFDRHVAFFQYYRSGGSHMDRHYFLRGQQENTIDVDVCQFDEDPAFSTGYDHLVARIIAMEMLYAFLSFRRTCLKNSSDGDLVELLKVKGSYQWTGTVVELVELIYALCEVKCINNGEVPITELATFFGTLLGVDLRECYGTYADIKHRKNANRTYFLDKMSKELNKRMVRDEDKEKKRR